MAASKASRMPKQRYALIPGTDHVCGFCVMLGSRGFVYEKPFEPHRNCHCDFALGIQNVTKIDGYDRQALLNAYNDARKTLGGTGYGSNLWKEWNSLPDSEKLKYEKSKLIAGEEIKGKNGYNAFCAEKLSAEIETRDVGWVTSGKVPKVTYANEDVRKKVEKNPHELITAERLAKHGIQVDFRVDSVEIAKGVFKGYPDLDNGYELKTLKGASSYGTVDGHIQNGAKKEGVVAIVFDNSDNEKLSDSDAESFILKSKRFSRGRIYLLTKDLELKRVR